MQVKELMKIPYKIVEDISLSEAATKMSNDGIGSIIISDKSGKVRGIITERDVIKNFGSKKSVFQIMSKNVITVDAFDEIKDALEIMKENKVKRLPVVHEGKLVGVISVTDLLSEINDADGDFFFN